MTEKISLDAMVNASVHTQFAEISQMLKQYKIPSVTIIVPDMPPCRFVIDGGQAARGIGGLASRPSTLPLGDFRGKISIEYGPIKVKGKSGHGFNMYIATVHAETGDEQVAVIWNSRREVPRYPNKEAEVIGIVSELSAEEATALEPIGLQWRELNSLLNVRAQVVTE